MDDQMDYGRADRCAAWLARLGEWCGSDRRAGIACEVVRGIVDVDEPEYAAAVAWAGGEPTAADFSRALVLYGSERAPIHVPNGNPPIPSRSELLASAALRRDRRAVREVLR